MLSPRWSRESRTTARGPMAVAGTAGSAVRSATEHRWAVIGRVVELMNPRWAHSPPVRHDQHPSYW